MEKHEINSESEQYHPSKLERKEYIGIGEFLSLEDSLPSSDRCDQKAAEILDCGDWWSDSYYGFTGMYNSWPRELKDTIMSTFIEVDDNFVAIMDGAPDECDTSLHIVMPFVAAIKKLDDFYNSKLKEARREPSASSGSTI